MLGQLCAGKQASRGQAYLERYALAFQPWLCCLHRRQTHSLNVNVPAHCLSADPLPFQLAVACGSSFASQFRQFCSSGLSSLPLDALLLILPVKPAGCASQPDTAIGPTSQACWGCRSTWHCFRFCQSSLFGLPVHLALLLVLPVKPFRAAIQPGTAFGSSSQAC